MKISLTNFHRLWIICSILIISGLLLVNPVKAEGNNGAHYSVFDSSVQNWTPYYDGNAEAWANPITAVRIDIDDILDPYGSIRYCTHNANIGWTGWGTNDVVVGDNANPVQAIRINLTGQLRYQYDIFYRVFSPTVGWSGWARNGAAAGSEGMGRDCTGFQTVFAAKGTVPVGQVGDAFIQRGWAWPVPGHTSISSPFGPRDGNHHDGFDIPAPGGTPIVSAKNGIVKMAAPDGNFGNCVCIQHDSGETVYYAHMSQIGCAVNQRVAKGQVIGLVGTTGNSLGNHLHMEIYNDWDENVNPQNYY